MQTPDRTAGVGPVPDGVDPRAGVGRVRPSAEHVHPGVGHPLAAEHTHAAAVHRMPVVALDGRIVGYTVTIAGDPEQADRLYLDLDLANLVADRYAFLPATPSMLEGFVPSPVVPGRLVLELPRGYELTPGVTGRAGALRGLGMALSLLGFRGEPAQVALLPFLAFVVVDAAEPQLASHVHQAHLAGVRVLATGVDSPTAEDACRAAGVDGVRGAARALAGSGDEAPRTVPAQRSAGTPTRVLRAGEMQCLAILHLLAQPEVAIADVAQVIETDPVLTLRVLHLVNSGAYALTQQVDTVRQAVVLLGTTEIWTLVTALALDARTDAMDRLWVILARAMSCEVLADDPVGYTVGMLSGLAAQLGVPADAVLDKVGVSAVVAEAIRAETGPLGLVLRAVRAHERSDVAGVLATGLVPGVVSRVYVGCLRDALAIARTVTREPGF